MQLVTRRRLGSAVIIGVLLALFALALVVTTPAKAYAASKIDIHECSIAFDYKSDYDKYNKDRFSSNLTKRFNASSSAEYRDALTYKGNKAIVPKLKITYEERVVTGTDEDGNENWEWVTTTLKKNKDYTIQVFNNKQVGLAYALITGIGKYKGTYSETFEISPAAPVISKARGEKRAITVTFKKPNTNNTSGYVVYVYRRSDLKTKSSYYDDKDETTKYKYIDQYKLVKSVSIPNAATSVTINGLKKNTEYYVIARAYKNVSNNYQISTDIADYGFKLVDGEYKEVENVKPKYVLADRGGAYSYFSQYSNTKKVKTK